MKTILGGIRDVRYDVIKWKHFPRYWPFVRGIHRPSAGHRPVMRSFDVFLDLRLNKRVSKQSWGWWFETSSRSLWRHCNVDNQYLSHLNVMACSSIDTNPGTDLSWQDNSDDDSWSEVIKSNDQVKQMIFEIPLFSAVWWVINASWLVWANQRPPWVGEARFTLD